MKYLLVVAFVACVSAQGDDPWEYNATPDGACLNEQEFTNLWMIFDLNDDGNITHLEFDTAYNRFHFENREQEDRFFLELDRVPDEHLDAADFTHIFKFFDIDASGCVDRNEWRRNWRSLTEN